MYHLIYRSHAPAPLDTAHLACLLADARTFNQRHDMTGLLLYSPNEQFLQVLEGDEQTVRAVYYGPIAAVRRHRDCVVLSEGPWPRRSFPTWSMGFLTDEHADAPSEAGYLQISRIRFVLLLFAPAHYAPSNLLLRFIDRYDEHS